MAEKILVTGALGQIGSELTWALRARYGEQNVLATDIRETAETQDPNYKKLDVEDAKYIEELVEANRITTVYHLAGLLSATAEKHQRKAWDLNIGSLLTFLDLAKEKKIQRLFWPSSIAVFGPDTPKFDTPQYAIAIPTTVYGVSKKAGELWCNYYFEKYEVDVRSIRYPGLISWKTLPGGGTTDYAVDIFYKALEERNYDCFLTENTALPMMYMDDAIRGTMDLMDAPSERISVRTSYNFTAMSFTPAELAAEIKKHISDFKIEYHPDFRQKIADSWPASIDDDYARRDWDWKPEFDLSKMTAVMLKELRKKLGI